MIEVNVRKDGITVAGHARYASAGSDIVCAGVSTLFQTLIKAITGLTDDRISYTIAPGASNIKYGNLSEQSRTLVDSFFIGVSMIAGEYPDYVRIV